MKKLSFYFIVAMMIPNVVLVVTARQHFLVAMANVLLPLGIYMSVATARRTALAIWLMLPVMVLSAFQIVLTMLFGESIIGVDMFINVVTTNTTEITELLGNLIPAVVTVVVIYVPLLTMAAVVMARDKVRHDGTARARGRQHTSATIGHTRRKGRRAAVAVTMAGLLSALVAIGNRGVALFTDDVFPANVIYNLTLAVERYRATSSYADNVRGFTFHASKKDTGNDEGREVTVVVIGETARAENFGILGYRRPTTPRLQQTQGLTAFRDAWSESNTTHKSVPMLLSAVDASTFDSIYGQRSLITAFKEAGYKTVWLSNQRRNGSFIDFFGEEADVCRFIKDDFGEGVNVTDGRLLDYMIKEMSDSCRRLLIVLHCYGSHFNYRERYGKRFSRFRPDDNTEAKAENRRDLVNAYDNTIYYTDHLLASIIDMLKERGGDAVMVYTSDHGEDLYDDGKRFLHASIRPTDHQLHVPLLVWTSQSYAARHTEMAEALEINKGKMISTSRSLFHTVLQLSGIETPWLRRQHSLADTLYRPQSRLYLNDRNDAEKVDE